MNEYHRHEMVDCLHRDDPAAQHECEHAPWRCRCANELDALIPPHGASR